MICRICTSPYRTDVNVLISKEIQISTITERIWRLFPGATYAAVYNSVLNHKNKKHKVPEDFVVDLPKHTPVISLQSPVQQPPEAPEAPEKKEVTLDDYAKALMEKAMDPTMMDKLTPATILQAQKMLFERDKVKVQNSQLITTLKKFMSGTLEEQDIEDIKKLVSDYEMTYAPITETE